MPVFVPEDLNFCYARVEGKNSENVKFMMNWLSYWLKFQKDIRKKGSLIFDIDNTLVDNEECNVLFVT